MQILLCIIGLIAVCRATFDVEKAPIKVDVEGIDIIVTVPNDSEVKSIYFSTELSDVCSSEYALLQRGDNSSLLSYKQSLKQMPRENDELRLFGVYETEEDVITKTYDFKIDDAGNGVRQTPPETEDVCEVEETKETSSKISAEKGCILAESEHDDICTNQLIFEENFNDGRLAQWYHAIYSRVSTWHVEFAVFLNSRQNSYVSDGKLHIAVTVNDVLNAPFNLSDCTSQSVQHKVQKCGPFYSAQMSIPKLHSATLHTKNKFAFKYGRVEIRARMPIGDWLFPYLLLQPIDTDVESDSQKHIRIAYVRGNPELRDTADNNIGGNVVYGSVFTQIDKDGDILEIDRQFQPLSSGKHYGEEFHNYTMIWHKDRIIFKVDGVTYGTITNKNALHELNKSEAYYIVLALTAGGIYNFKEQEIDVKEPNQFDMYAAKSADLFSEKFCENVDATWRHPRLIIDHVRVYTTHPDEE